MRPDHDNMQPFNRSRVTNGSALLPGVSNRSTWARRLRDLIEIHSADRGDDLSEAERSIIRRASVLTVELEYQEARFATMRESGRQPSALELDVYSRLTGQLRRLLETIGIDRRPRDVTRPQRQSGALADYIDGDGQ